MLFLTNLSGSLQDPSFSLAATLPLHPVNQTGLTTPTPTRHFERVECCSQLRPDRQSEICWILASSEDVSLSTGLSPLPLRMQALLPKSPVSEHRIAGTTDHRAKMCPLPAQGYLDDRRVRLTFVHEWRRLAPFCLRRRSIQRAGTRYES